MVATLDRNRNIIIRNDPGGKGEAVFTNERNFLINQSPNPRFLTYRNSWPDEPRRFIDPNVFKKFYPQRVEQIKNVCDKIEGLSWGLFHSDQPTPEKININNPEQIQGQYVIGEKEHNKISWIEEEQVL